MSQAKTSREEIKAQIISAMKSLTEARKNTILADLKRGNNTAFEQQLGKYTINIDSTRESSTVNIGDIIHQGVSHEELIEILETFFPDPHIAQPIVQKTSEFSAIASRTYARLESFLRQRDSRYILKGLKPKYTHEGDLTLVCEAEDAVLGRDVMIKALKLLEDNSDSEATFKQF